jgi:uncharacterized protein
MKNISITLKPASSLCNLRCRYCFYANVSSLREVRSYGIMSRETAERILDHTFCDLEAGDSVTFGFQGGEPTLAGLDFFKGFVDAAKSKSRSIAVSYALQTNGILLDDAWCGFLKENRFLVGLSLDALRACHDENRVDPKGKGTYRRVIDAKALLDKHRVDCNILTVLTAKLARHPQQVWAFMERQRIRHIQFIPCLSDLDSEEPSNCALSPRLFASFYSTLFALWKRSWDRGHYISVKLFDDLINMLASGSVNACGLRGECMTQIIVEADGSAYPCDFYVLDAYRVGNFREDRFSHIYESPVIRQFQQREHTQPRMCAKCPYLRICRGGCKRMQQEICCGPNDGYCGYQEFMNNCMPELMRVARQIG